jgi:hypothetical protein
MYRRTRVAIFFWVKHTRMSKIYQMATTYTKRPNIKQYFPYKIYPNFHLWLKKYHLATLRRTSFHSLCIFGRVVVETGCGSSQDIFSLEHNADKTGVQIAKQFVGNIKD